jgi:hypothetical protein
MHVIVLYQDHSPETEASLVGTVFEVTACPSLLLLGTCLPDWCSRGQQQPIRQCMPYVLHTTLFLEKFRAFNYYFIPIEAKEMTRSHLHFNLVLLGCHDQRLVNAA